MTGSSDSQVAPPPPESYAIPLAGRIKLPWHRARTSALSIGLPILGLLISLAIGAVLLSISGANPIVAYKALFMGAFGNWHNLIETLVKTTPILFVALGVTFAFRCTTWNIGAEGQLQLGAVGATLMGLALRSPGITVPNAVGTILIIVAGFAAGGLYAGIAGFLKAKWDVNEVITTIMMNFTGILLVEYLCFGPLRDPDAYGQPFSPYIAEASRLPRLIPKTHFHLGVALSFITAIIVYLILWKTTLGYRVRAVGANRTAAKHAGISVTQTVFLAMVISGGIAGLAGVSEIAGLHYRLLSSFSPKYGSAGTIVAILGNLHPFAIIPAAILFGGLLIGADAMAREVQVSTSIVTVIQGLMVLFVLGSQFLVAELEG
jgi:ABC-type uncharacterized transport system permease subunit